MLHSKFIEVMPDPFGLVSGAVGIAAAFTACVDCFKYVQSGRHLHRDLQTELLSLSCAGLRLTRWGDSVGIYDDPGFSSHRVSAPEVETAKVVLFQIMVLFEDTKKISDKYKVSASAEDTFAESVSEDPDPTIDAITTRVKAIMTRRQKGISLLKTTQWALYYKDELKGLIAAISKKIEELEKLVPAPTIPSLVREDVEEIIDISDVEDVGVLEDAVQDVDDALHEAIKDARLHGHIYRNMTIEGMANVGDAFSNAWTGSAIGRSHTYTEMKVTPNGRANFGNTYGQKGFWE